GAGVRAPIPSLARMPSGFTPLHTGRVAGVGARAHGGVPRLAYWPYVHAAGVCSRVCESVAAVTAGAYSRARRAGLAAVSAALPRSHSAAVAACGADRQPLLCMVA